MDNFQIEFDSPNDVYFPGQVVTGKVTIQNQEDIKAKFLKIFIYGGAHTGWIVSKNVNRTNMKGVHHHYKDAINYKGTIKYLSEELTAWSSEDGTDRLPSGTHTFSFSFVLPLKCSPSFESVYGHIRYSVHVELDRPWKSNKKLKKFFTVIPVSDLNTLPEAVTPIVKTITKDNGVFMKKGLVTMTTNFPKSGYKIINVYFCISVKLESSSTFSWSLEEEFPLIIGTIPVRTTTVPPIYPGPVLELPPPSYQESMLIRKAEGSESFSPLYPVFNDLPPYSPSEAPGQAPPLPIKSRDPGDQLPMKM